MRPEQRHHLVDSDGDPAAREYRCRRRVVACAECVRVEIAERFHVLPQRVVELSFAARRLGSIVIAGQSDNRNRRRRDPPRPLRLPPAEFVCP
jgi:hypothetical protein